MKGKQIKKGKYLTAQEISSAQEGARKTWPAAQFWRYMAHLKDMGTIKVAQGHQQLGEEWGMRVSREGASPKALLERRVASAAEWMAKYVTCAEGKWQMKIGQVESMAQDLTRGASRGERGVQRIEIYAALVKLAAEGRVRMEMRMVGKGGAERDWIQEVQEWLSKAGGCTTGEANKMILRASSHITDKMQDMSTVIELGTGYWGACDGMVRQVERVVTVDREGHNLGTLRGFMHPEITATFERGGKQTIVELVKQRGKVRTKELVGIWLSANCAPWSKSQGLCKMIGCAKGPSGGVKVGEEELAGLDAALEALEKYVQADPVNNKYFIENVEGELKHYAKMQSKFGEGVRRGAREGKVNGCAYGLKHQGTYHFWTNLTTAEWMPRKEDEYCRHCRNRTRHEEVMIPGKGDKRSRPTLEGYTGDAAKNRVPPDMAESVAAGFMKAAEARKKKAKKRKRHGN